uniref:Uncharacterized protein n=1 Tax=Arundo donax TaxID=35708 RepID=A0A0A9BM96_ARUDO
MPLLFKLTHTTRVLCANLHVKCFTSF